MMELTERETLAVCQRLDELVGLQFSPAALPSVQRRVAERVTSSGLGSVGRYLEYVVEPAGQHELGALLDSITTPETYFLRQHYQFKAFKHEILPRILRDNALVRRLTIWSAGCSTGEETYTLATMVAESEQLAGWKVRILGSDLSASRLAVAREGRYGKSSFRAVDAAFRQRYFSAGTQDGEWFVKPELKRMCQFVQTNLAMPDSTAVVGSVDVAFCRNVLIYLSPRARDIATAQIVERLVVGGYLFLGHSESLLNSTLPIEAVHLQDDVVYRRKDARR